MKYQSMVLLCSQTRGNGSRTNAICICPNPNRRRKNNGYLQYDCIGGGTSDWELIYEGNYTYSGSPSTSSQLRINDIPSSILLSAIDHYVLLIVEETYAPSQASRTTGGWYVGAARDYDGDVGAFLGGFCMTNDGPYDSSSGLDWYGGSSACFLYLPRASSASYQFRIGQKFSIKIYKHS